MADQPPITVESLARVPLLSHCSTEELSALASAAKPVPARQGAVVVREGEAADSLFVVVSGQVRVVSDAATERLLLARLGPGEFFGEMALVEGGRRSAAVVADRESALLEISREAFQQIVAAEKVMADVRQTLSHRMADTQQQMLQDATVISRESGLITIGRDAANAIFINEPGVRAHHAEIVVSPAGFRIHSLGGLPDTFLNGEPIVEASLEEGDEVRIGSVRLFLHQGTIKRFQAARGIRIEAIGIGRTVAGGRQLLRDISLAISPGELVALVGPSGAGKTTLLHALLGLTRPTDGTVYYDSLRLDEHEGVFRPVLGYVPQQDILHEELSVRQALWYVGRLRLPGDTSAGELNRRIDAVLEAVSLTREAQTKVSKLSGGQRKRASIAGELLSEPRVFFLDEPTSGLDPGLDAQMMRKFRELADEGRTVLVTTHATKNIELCDRVVIVVRGQLVFVGTPRQALEYFGVSDFTDIYARLAADEPDEQAAAFRASDTYRLNVAECLTVTADVEGAPPPKPQRRADRPNALARTTRGIGKVARQWFYLGSRDVRVTIADRLTMAVRVFGPPLLAASLLLTFERDILAETLAQGGNARASLTLLYLAAAVSLFLGAFTASNAITRESAIFRRERMVDLSALAYVLAKVTVLGAFALFQGFIVVAVLAIGIDFPGPKAEVLLQLGLAMSVTSLAGTSLGLLVSSLSPNADRAAILVVLLIIPQLVFAGSTVPRSEMSGSALITSDAMVSKWSVELLAGIVDLDRRLDVQSYIEVAPTAGGPKIAVQVPDRPFEKAFRGDLALRWLVLAGFSVVFVAGTLVVQSRKRANR